MKNQIEKLTHKEQCKLYIDFCKLNNYKFNSLRYIKCDENREEIFLFSFKTLNDIYLINLIHILQNHFDLNFIDFKLVSKTKENNYLFKIIF